MNSSSTIKISRNAVWLVALLTGCALEPQPDGSEARQGVERAATDGDESPCPDGALCLYERPDRGGVMVVLSPGAHVYDLRTIPCQECLGSTIGHDSTFDKKMSSWENRTSIASCFYEKPQQEGPQYVMPI